MTLEPGFWDNPKKAESVLKGIKQKKIWTEGFDFSLAKVEDLAVLYEFYQANEISEEELNLNYSETCKIVEELELKNMLSGEEDMFNCIINTISHICSDFKRWQMRLLNPFIVLFI